ncbi:uncharacterized protein [Primulina eburnea]|uniref:uncharacterized protein n=1 Tax=Primulina eburnea TaxID=1245227 RepID=UPI003C6C3191
MWMRGFCFGAAFLAQSMHQVRCLRENLEATTTSACIPFFMVFLFEYVKDIASSCIRGRVVVVPPLNFPLIVSWSDLLGIKTQNNHGKLSQDEYVYMLGRNELILRPYERLPADFLPVRLRAQLHVAYTHTVMICFEQSAYHVPHVCPKKLGLQ